MSSESNGEKPDSLAAGPPSGVTNRTSARAPSAWGAVRDGLAAVHNLEALLRSSSVQSRTILDLLPELRTSAGVLRAAFERSTSTEPAAAAVGEHGRKAVDGFDALLDAIAVLERENAVTAWRDLMGATDPAKAAAGTIRKQFGSNVGENATHGSDSVDNARIEIAYFFAGAEVSPTA